MDSGLFALGICYGLVFSILIADAIADYTARDVTPDEHKKAARRILKSFVWPIVFIIWVVAGIIRTIVRLIRDAI